MSVRCCAAFLSVGFVSMATAACWAETLAPVEKKIIAEAKLIHSLSAGLTVHTKLGGSTSQDTTVVVTYEFLRKGGKGLFRREGKTTGTRSSQGIRRRIDRDLLSIYDGDVLYAFSDTRREDRGSRTAIKVEYDESKDIMPSTKYFEALHSRYDLRLAPEEKVDGQAAYVIVATPKPGGDPNEGKSTYYFSKSFGIPVKKVTETKDGKPFLTMSLSKIKMNPPMDPKRFVFHAPQGVDVIDLVHVRRGAVVPAGGTSGSGKKKSNK